MYSNVFPSVTTWTTPRTDEIKLTTDNCKLFTNTKIEKLEKIIAKIKASDFQFTITWTNNVGQIERINVDAGQIFLDSAHQISLEDAGFDITKYVVEKAKYSTLKTYTNTAVLPDYFTDLYVNNTSYWTQNTNEIVLVNTPFNGWLQVIQNDAFETLIMSALVDIIQTQGIYAEFSDNPPIYDYINKDNFGNLAGGKTPTFKLTEVFFRVYYQTLGESVKINTPKTRPTTAQQFTMPFSQQQQIVDSIAQGRNTLATANRTGVRKKDVLRTITDLSQLRKLGAVVYQKDTNGNPTNAYWRLIEIEKTVYPRKMVVKETWAENWSFESEYTAVDRRFRSWNIPSDILQRNCLWEDYCVITDNDNTVTGTGALIGGDAQGLILRTLTTAATSKNSECLNMWLYTAGTPQSTGVVLTCSAFGYGNSLVFAGRTKDNLSAGIQRSAEDDTYCRDVYYCNDDGTLPVASWQIGASVQNSADSNGENLYPQYIADNNIGGLQVNGIDYTNGYTLFTQSKEVKLLKAPAEQINMIYQLHILSVADDIVVGTAWASSCPLVKEWNGATIVRKVWALTRKLPQGTQTMTSRYGQEVPMTNQIVANPGGNTFTFNKITAVENCVGICLTDGDNNIIVAQNSNETKTYKLQFTHNYAQVVAFDKQYNERLAAMEQIPTLAQLRAQGKL